MSAKNLSHMHTGGIPDKRIRYPIVGLSAAQILNLRRISHYRGLDGLPFLKSVVWWWIPLEKLFRKQKKIFEMPSATDRGFFPKSLFAGIQQSQKLGDLQGLFNSWFDIELAARLSPRDDACWPAYYHTAPTVYMGDDFKDAHLATVPSMTVDLRKSDSELTREFKVQLKEVRREHRGDLPFPVTSHSEKAAKFTRSIFHRIELIDRRKLLGQTVDGDAWANVNKAVRIRGPYLFLSEKALAAERRSVPAN